MSNSNSRTATMDHILPTTLQAPEEHDGAEPTEKNLASIVTNLNHPNAHNRRIAHYYYAKLTGSPVPRSSTDTEDLRQGRAKLHNSEFWVWLRMAVLGAVFAIVEAALILMLTAGTKIAVSVGVTGCIVVAIVTGVMGWRMVIEDEEGIKGKERKCQMALAELYAAEERHNKKNQRKREKAQCNLEDGLGWACSDSVKSENEEELSRGEPSLADAEEVGTLEFGNVRWGKGVENDDDPGQGTVLEPAPEAQGLLPPLDHDQAKRSKAEEETNTGHSSPTNSSTATATQLQYERESRRLPIERTSSQTAASASKPDLKDNLRSPSSTPANSSMSRSKPSVASMYRKLSVPPTPSDVPESLVNACSKDVVSPIRQLTRSNSTVSGTQRVPYPGCCRTIIAIDGNPSNYKDWIADRRNPYSHSQNGSCSRQAKARNGSNIPFGISESSVRDQKTLTPSFPSRSTFTHAVPERGSSLVGPSYPYPQSKNQHSHHSFRKDPVSKDFYTSDSSRPSPPPIFRSRSEEIAAESGGSYSMQISATLRPVSIFRGEEPPLSKVQPNQDIPDAEHIKNNAADSSTATLGDSMVSNSSLEAPAAAQVNDDRRSLPSMRRTRRESPYMRRYIPRQCLNQKASDEESAMHEPVSAANGEFALSEGESSDDGPFEHPTLSAPQEVGELSHAPAETPQENAKVWEGLGIDLVHEKVKCKMLGIREWQKEPKDQQRLGSGPEDPSEVVQARKTDAELAQNVFNVAFSSKSGELLTSNVLQNGDKHLSKNANVDSRPKTPINAEFMNMHKTMIFTGLDSPANKRSQNTHVEYYEDTGCGDELGLCSGTGESDEAEILCDDRVVVRRPLAKFRISSMQLGDRFEGEASLKAISMIGK